MKIMQMDGTSGNSIYTEGGWGAIGWPIIDPEKLEIPRQYFFPPINAADTARNLFFANE